jgi:hypothetical protein
MLEGKWGHEREFLDFVGSCRSIRVYSVDKHVYALDHVQRNTSIRGINLGIGEIIYSDEYLKFEDSVVSCEVSLLASMEGLHLLRLDGCQVVVPDDFSSWPQELRWLQWRSFYFSTLPPHLKLSSLVVMDLRGSDKLTRLWKCDADIQVFY